MEPIFAPDSVAQMLNMAGLMDLRSIAVRLSFCAITLASCMRPVYPIEKSAASNSTASTTVFNYSWAGVATCRTLSGSPAFTFSNFPPNTRRVSLLLTQGERELGGQEISFPETGVIPAGAITITGPCVAGVYRWTASLKSAAGETLAIVRRDRTFPD
jgi:hypothetical protein